MTEWDLQRMKPVFQGTLYVYQLTVFTSCYTFHLCFLASLDVKCAGAVQVLLEKIID